VPAFYGLQLAVKIFGGLGDINFIANSSTYYVKIMEFAVMRAQNVQYGK
jgi:hypothetical protein